jgi:predicted secreted Zn-dependent protease
VLLALVLAGVRRHRASPAATVRPVEQSANEASGPPAPERSAQLDRALRLGRALRSGREGLVVTERVEHYRVRGSTSAELHAAVDSTGPMVYGRHQFAKTHVRADPRLVPAGGGACLPQETKVELVLTVVLPEWRPTESAGADLRRDWERSIRRAEAHENDHKDIARYYAGVMLREARSLRLTSCAELNAAVNDLDEIVAEHDRVQRRYDDESAAELRRPLPRF